QLPFFVVLITHRDPRRHRELFSDGGCYQRRRAQSGGRGTGDQHRLLRPALPRRTVVSSSAWFRTREVFELSARATPHDRDGSVVPNTRSEEHTSELQS